MTINLEKKTENQNNKLRNYAKSGFITSKFETVGPNLNFNETVTGKIWNIIVFDF